MKKKIIFVLTAAMLLISPVMLSSCGDEEENEPVQNNSGKNNGTNNNQQTVKEESKYTVSYSSDFGVAPQSLAVKEGDKLTSGDLKPLDTDGYIFLGWYNGSNQVEEGFVVKQDLKLVAKWTKDGVVYANELKDFLAKKTDDSKVYDVIILDLKPDMEVIVNALVDNPKVKINLDLEGCTDLTEVVIMYGEPTPIPPNTDPDPNSEPTPIPPNTDPNPNSEPTNLTNTEEPTTHINRVRGDNSLNMEQNINIDNLLSIKFSNSVTLIKISNCNNLKSLNIPNSVRELSTNMKNPPAILNANTINYNCTIYVPASAIETYKNAEGWRVYANQIKPIDDDGTINLYVSELEDYLSNVTDDSKIYNIKILDKTLNGFDNDSHSIDFIISKFAQIKVNLDLSECTQLKQIGPNLLSGQILSNNWNLLSLNIPESVTHLVLQNYVNLTIFNIPKSVTTLGVGGCDGLTSLEIPNSVTDFQFESCAGITSLTITNNVKRIYLDDSDNNLTSIYLSDIPPTIDNWSTINPNCTIYVPASAVETYKNANGWSKYTEQIKAFIEEAPTPDPSTTPSSDSNYDPTNGEGISGDVK